MYNTDSIKGFTEAYESFKGIAAKKVTWNGIKETTPFEFEAGVACMKLADALVEQIIQQDKLIRDMHGKMNQLEELLQKIDSEIERPD